ncbi:peptidase associated/transthyretin-like domain-containing protein [Flavobacterium cellulosilyticum]|uniref:Carboxypeptidase-like regulatory domain-containing protein n=1 Tax=Flavobacterium cellulosilyticum TaxID=2541731 RepID=A0A4R5C782_9FLAO|nr:hypothetical protein [Flavobacterium cellulosilyticum]TDD93983.1 hypothetical protein E0F76_17780 [Flavobacterium cellulosilyticum]
MRSTFLFLFVLTIHSCFSQELAKVKIKGAIRANTHDLEGIYVINLKTEKSTVTDKEGFFVMEAIPGDTLIFSAIHLKELRIELTPNNFQKELFDVKMELRINQLNEVLINRYDYINAVSLGISPSGIKHLTQAERHLKTATGLNATASAGSMAGGSVSLDPLLNLISGRTAMLKKELEVEKKLSYMQLIDNMFDETYFRKNLKIPADYIKGFKYYMVDNQRFTNVLKTKNKITIDFLMGELSIKYIEIIACENE